MVLGTACSTAPTAPTPTASDAGIHKIKHVIVILQENRSFDSYFGTFPGADGIPMRNGVPDCVRSRSANGTCDRPYVDHADVNGGGPHGAASATADINCGKMNGFVAQADRLEKGCARPQQPGVLELGRPRRDGLSHPERHPQLLVLCEELRPPGPHVRAERVVEPARAPLPRLRVVRALHPAQQPGKLRERAAEPRHPAQCQPDAHQREPDSAWPRSTRGPTSRTCFTRTRCRGATTSCPAPSPTAQNDSAVSCAPVRQNSATPGIWNPLPFFDTVRNDGQLGNIQSVGSFYPHAKAGTLPAVSWVMPSGEVSEHPPAPGQLRAVVRHQPRQRGDGEPGLEARARSS